MAKRKTKLSFEALVGGGKPNADLYKNDAEKRKRHVAHRAARSKLLTATSLKYKRALSGDPARDVLYHELAREFINNGFLQAEAYAAVFGMDLKKAQYPASRIFKSVWMRQLVLQMLQGEDGKPLEETLEKDFLLSRLVSIIDANVLDYFDDEGKPLTIMELKALPVAEQRKIKNINFSSWQEPVLVPGTQREVMVTHQSVHLELWDKQKAMETLARAMKWIQDKTSDLEGLFSAELLIAAHNRVRRLSKIDDEGDFIEGTVKRIASD